MASVLHEVQKIFQDYFDDENLVVNMDTNSNDIEEWDSLAQIVLLDYIQDQFEIEIDTNDIVTLRSVGDIVQFVEKRLSA